MPPGDTPKDAQKRNFLKLMGILVIGAGVAGTLRSVVQDIIPSVSNVESSFPSLLLVLENGNPVHTSDLTTNTPAIVTFEYPLQNEPSFLLRLGDANNNDLKIGSSKVTVPATGGTYQAPAGVGPYGSVVASSAICEHLGCIPPENRFYPPSSPTYPGKIHCGCHGSIYDPYTGFSVVAGPTKLPLPAVALTYDSAKDTYSATNMIGPTIYGHTSDLSGGNSISTSGTTVTATGG